MVNYNDMMILIQTSKRRKLPVIPEPSSTRVESNVGLETSDRVPWSHITDFTQLVKSIEHVEVKSLINSHRYTLTRPV